MQKLTAGEQKVYDFITEYIKENGFSPSIREICKSLSYASTSTVHLYLSKLSDKGYIEKEYRKSRSFRPLTGGTGGIPVLGRVHAGYPADVTQLSDEYISIGDVLPYKEQDVFALRVTGDSMQDAGIYEGDTVIVHRQELANDGDIVVAMVDGEVTVKTLWHEKSGYRLQPENKNYSPIFCNELTLVGKVVLLLRKFSK